MRLVDADYVLEACNGFRNNPSRKFNYGMRLVEEIVKNAPTADAEPIRHGHWEDHAVSIKGVPTEACSVCGEWTYGDCARFCPNCGAIMDEEVEEDEIN